MCGLEDIYISEKKGDKWSQPKPIEEINTSNHDATIGLSPDGQKLFVYKNPPGSGDIFHSELKGTEWTKPQSMGKMVNSKDWEEAISLSPDGKTIFFTSDRPGGKGLSDIYVARMDEKGEWGQPENLSSLNTPYWERTPFIHPNGVELFFSTNGRQDCIYRLFHIFLVGQQGVP